jgi:alpha-1,2-mannosyltransferase
MPKAIRIATVTAIAAAVAAFLDWYGNRHDFFDLRIYVSAMRWWADGHPLYDYAQPDRVQGELYFTYPPFAAALLRPLAEIPVGATIVIFLIGTAVAIGVTTWWLVHPVALRHAQPPWFVAGIAIPLVFVIEPTRETFTFGQINMLLVVLVLGDLLLLVPRNSRWAGVGVGLATALKLYPGIFIVYLLAARRWRAAITASAAAAGATLLAAAMAPQDSWQFWTRELWSTDRVGRTDYTGNQSLLGLIGRAALPADPSSLVWAALVALIAGYGLWRAAQAARAGDEVAGLALAGLVGALASPIAWTHHVYWFVPAFVVLVDAGLRERDLRPRLALLGLAVAGYLVLLRGVVSFDDWGIAPLPTDSVGEFVRRNAYVLLTLVLIAVLPVRTGVLDYRRRGAKWTDLPTHARVG